MSLAKTFRDLHVYQGAREAAKQVFLLTQSFPRDERFSLTDQIRRAARSICANIAEAWRKRRYEAASVSKLSDADAEAAECQAWFDHALDCAYIDIETFETFDTKYQHIGAQLRLMMESADQWCKPQAKQH